MPWVRAVATSRLSPALASQAEKASSNSGDDEKLVEESSSDHKESARKSESIMPSKHSRADRRWVR